MNHNSDYCMLIMHTSDHLTSWSFGVMTLTNQTPSLVFHQEEHESEQSAATAMWEYATIHKLDCSPHTITINTRTQQ